MTVYEKIKNMAIEDLVEFFDKIAYCCINDSECDYCPLYSRCIDITSSKLWLESDVEE